MAGAYIFGSDYGNLASNKLGYDTLNSRLAQEAASRAQQDYQFQVNSQIEQQRQAEQNQRAAAAAYYQSVQNQHADDLQSRSEANRNYQFNAGLTAQKDVATESAKEFNQGLALKRELGQEKTDQTSAKADFKTASELVNAGVYDAKPDDISKDFSHLTTQEVKALNNVWDLRTKQRQDQYDALASKAASGTRLVQSLGNGPARAKDVFELENAGLRYDPNQTNFSVGIPRPMGRPVVPPSTNAPAGYQFTAPPAVGASLPQTSTVVNPNAVQPPVITTQAQYDALPPGTLYMDSTGKRATKKAAAAQ